MGQRSRLRKLWPYPHVRGVLLRVCVCNYYGLHSRIHPIQQKHVYSAHIRKQCRIIAENMTRDIWKCVYTSRRWIALNIGRDANAYASSLIYTKHKTQIKVSAKSIYAWINAVCNMFTITSNMAIGNAIENVNYEEKKFHLKSIIASQCWGPLIWEMSKNLWLCC